MATRPRLLGGYAVALILASFSVSGGFADLRMRAYPNHVVDKYIPAVAAGTYGAPADYRVLIPLVVSRVAAATGADPRTVWHATRLFSFVAAYFALHWYLRTWFAPPQALAGSAFVAATLPLTFTNSWAHPDHIPELALFTLGCAAIARNRDGLFALILAVATLNRETAAFLVLLYAVAGPFSRQRLQRSVLFGALWLATSLTVRTVQGFEHYDYWQLARNLEFLRLLPSVYDPYYRAYAYFVVAAFLPLTVLAIRGIKAKPVFVRRALLVAPLFVTVAFVISSIIETRVFTPLYPVMLPAAMFSLFEPIRDGRTPSDLEDRGELGS